MTLSTLFYYRHIRGGLLVTFPISSENVERSFALSYEPSGSYPFSCSFTSKTLRNARVIRTYTNSPFDPFRYLILDQRSFIENVTFPANIRILLEIDMERQRVDVPLSFFRLEDIEDPEDEFGEMYSVISTIPSDLDLTGGNMIIRQDVDRLFVIEPLESGTYRVMSYTIRDGEVTISDMNQPGVLSLMFFTEPSDYQMVEVDGQKLLINWTRSHDGWFLAIQLNEFYTRLGMFRWNDNGSFQFVLLDDLSKYLDVERFLKDWN